VDIIVAECGTPENLRSPYATVSYADPDNEKGKTYCHDLAYQKAKERGPYDYFYVLMNDAVFETEEKQDPISQLVDAMERAPHLGMLAPTNYGVGKDFPGAQNVTGAASGWRLAAVVDYLAIMMRGTALERTGFLNPIFRYSQGAEHELAYKMWSNHFAVAYSDTVSVRHLGPSTFGVSGTQTVSRVEYLEASIRFAKQYMEGTYGADWDERFWRSTLWQPVPTNVFTWWRRTFQTVLAKLDAGTHRMDPTPP
jgi:hypothetical protein